MNLRSAILVALLAWLAASPTRAGYSFEAPPSHPDWEPGIEALQRLDYAMAITHLLQVVKNEPDNADARNALGFAYLSTKRYDVALRHLREALKLDPTLLSAHENIGRVYVATGQRARAREHLAALERLCATAPCEEQRNLAAAIAAAR